MVAKKQTLDDFKQTCGQCKFCHEVPDNKREVGCYVEPPEYAYGETDIPDFLDYKPVKVNRYICRHFVSNNGAN